MEHIVSTTGTTEKPQFSIHVLTILRALQQQHGLRHGDYQRYQQFITRKLRRMRKSLHFQNGTKTKVTPKKLTVEIITEPRFILLKLFEIERTWAYAMQLKSESYTELRKRFHMFERLKKAVARAKNLSDLVLESNICDSQTKLEIQAYVQWIRSIQSFELKDWIKAKELLESTQKIYSGLAETMEEETRGIYYARVDELLPQVRYCAYNVGDATAASDLHQMRHQLTADGGNEMLLAQSQLDQLLSHARANQSSSVTEVDWFGVRIPVKLEKAREAILAVTDSDKEVLTIEGFQAKLSLYESVLKSCVEAIAAVRDEIRSVSQADASATGDASVAATVLSAAATTKNRPDAHVSAGSEKLARLQLLQSYLLYLKLSKTIERNLLHIDMAVAGAAGDFVKEHIVVTSGYNKPQELARLYDTLVQSLQEVSGLPGLLQERGGFKDLLSAKVLAYRSFRCYYLALAYLQGRKFSECSALLSRAETHVRNALEVLSPSLATWTGDEENVSPGISPERLSAQLNTLVRQIEAEDLTCRAGRMLQMATSDGIVALEEDTKLTEDLLQKPLIARLDTFVDEKSVEKSLTTCSQALVRFPPDFAPVMAKPTFFDLALNHIQFPSLDDKLGNKGPASALGSAKSGISGFVRGWLWGGSGTGVQNQDSSPST